MLVHAKKHIWTYVMPLVKTNNNDPFYYYNNDTVKIDLEIRHIKY